MSEFQTLVANEVKRLRAAGEASAAQIELDDIAMELAERAAIWDKPRVSVPNLSALVRNAARLQLVAEDNDLTIPDK